MNEKGGFCHHHESHPFEKLIFDKAMINLYLVKDFFMFCSKRKYVILVSSLLILMALSFSVYSIISYIQYQNKREYNNNCGLSYGHMHAILSNILTSELNDKSLYSLYKNDEIEGEWLRSPFSKNTDIKLYFSLGDPSIKLPEKEFNMTVDYVLSHDGKYYSIMDKGNKTLMMKGYINKRGDITIKKVQ